MSLGAHEQRTLSRIANELAASDPKLSSTLNAFSRLTHGEDMPLREHVGGTRRAVGHAGQRRAADARWPFIAAWIVMTTALITVALVLSHINHVTGGAQCAKTRPIACAGQ